MTMRLRPLGALAGLALLAGCGALDHGFLNAQGPVAAHERHFFVVVCGILVFVVAPVLLMVPAVAWHYRLRNTRDAYRPKWTFSWTLEGFIWLPPIGIVIGLAVLLWPATHQDDPYRRLSAATPPLHVQAIGLDWKWVFIYPDAGVVTVNRLAVPTGRPVTVELTSGTVMQSMLLPQLAGQIYAMAGMRTRLNFAADHDGRYLGENTQFNGAGFAQQKFMVVAMPPAAFAAWLARARSTAPAFRQQDWAALTRQDTAAPATYSAVPARFFATVVMANGGHSDPHPAKGPAS